MDTTTKPPPGSGPVEAPKAHKVHRVVQPSIADPGPTEEQQEEAIHKQVNEAESLWPMHLKLKRPIMIKDAKSGQVVQQVDVLELREPTAADIIACGVPVIVLDYQEGTSTFDAPKMAMMIARLSKTPPIYINAMDPIDFINVATMIQRNFLPDLGRML